MTTGIRSGVDFFIYSSFNIALAATALTLEGFFLFQQPINFNYLGFVFCATLLTYSVHRIVGIKKIGESFTDGRFKIINKFKSHLIFYSLLSIIGALYFFKQLDPDYTYYVLLLGGISALYTIPVFSNNKRLRDFDYIKIILIAFSWASVAVVPFLIKSNFPLEWLSLFFIEKMLFIFTITLPFDIRDLSIDTHSNVHTFPKLWGLNKTYNIINACLLFSCVLAIGIAMYLTNNYIVSLFVILAYMLSYLAICQSKGKQSDYYYAGILDGIITIRAFIIILGIHLLN